MTILKPGLNQWCMACEWRARVWLNGVDVTDRCRAVDLYELSDSGKFFVDEQGLIAHRMWRGDIRVEELRRWS